MPATVDVLLDSRSLALMALHSCGILSANSQRKFSSDLSWMSI